MQLGELAAAFAQQRFIGTTECTFVGTVAGFAHFVQTRLEKGDFLAKEIDGPIIGHRMATAPLAGAQGKIGVHGLLLLIWL